MSIQTTREGATAELLVQNFDADGALVARDGWALAAAWVPTVAIPSPPAAVITARSDLATWLVVAPTTGMGGSSYLLRVTATHAATGIVRITDTQYRVVE